MSTTFLGKINLADILHEHFATLIDTNTDKSSLTDRLLFFVGPAIPVAVMVVYSVKLTEGTISVLGTALSILAGLLFNLLVLLHTLTMPHRGQPFDRSVALLQRQLHANVAYAILVALIALVPLVVASYFGPLDLRRSVTGYIAIYLAIHFALTMGMILKRMDTLLQERVSED